MSASREAIAKALQDGLYRFASTQSSKYQALHNFVNTLYCFNIITEDEMNDLKHHYYCKFNPF